MPTLAHVSDLHLGKTPAHQQSAARVVDALLDAQVDHVVLTGDVTHSGRIDEYELYLALFGPLLREQRLTVIPGNHDRSGEDVAELLSDGLRVSVDTRPGLFMVCIDSTASHNRKTFRSHGTLCRDTLDSVDRALDLAPDDALVTILLHHHVVPLPVEGLGEWFAEKFGWPHAAELLLGRELLRRVSGRCDLVLHGHRHVPRHFRFTGERPLQVFNAGSSTELGAFRVFSHHGRMLQSPTWHAAQAQLNHDPTPLDAAGYRAWLIDAGAQYVALPDAPLDYAAVAEGRLVRAGVAGVTPVWSDAHWQVFHVDG